MLLMENLVDDDHDDDDALSEAAVDPDWLARFCI